MNKSGPAKGGKEEKKAARVYRRHKRVWAFVRFVGYPFIKLIYGYTYTKAPELKAPYLVLSNHNGDLDPAFVGFSFKQQMYVVASEHVYRRGFASKLLRWAFEPIAKIKGASDTLTVLKTIRMLRSGKNVCLFPEGNRSFNGVTGPITEATGKLVKTSAATLVTYRLSGGYMTTPRWGFGIRKGYFHGQVVNVYSPEQLKQMTAAQIAQAVHNDIYENAYKEQEEKQICYKGKKLAEGFEYAYCVCPECKTVGTIGSKENSVFCKKCGRTAQIDEKGFLSDGFGFKTAYEWDLWQEDFYKDFVSKALEKAEAATKAGAEDANSGESKKSVFLFSDSNVTLRLINSDHEETVVGTGSLALCTDKIVFASQEAHKDILISQIPDMSIYQKSGFQFTDAQGTHYEFLPAKKGEFYNARKYLSCWKYLRNI